MTRLEIGYSLSAVDEQRGEEEGYLFREFDRHSPDLAFGRLRRRIRRALAPHHLEELGLGVFAPLQDTLRGRISYGSEDGELAFVIDGKRLTLHEVGKLLEMNEGWRFRLDLLDSSQDVP